MAVSCKVYKQKGENKTNDTKRMQPFPLILLIRPYKMCQQILIIARMRNAFSIDNSFFFLFTNAKAHHISSNACDIFYILLYHVKQQIYANFRPRFPVLTQFSFVTKLLQVKTIYTAPEQNFSLGPAI